MKELVLPLILILRYTTSAIAEDCYCDEFRYFEDYFGGSIINTSLSGSVGLYVWAYEIYCMDIEIQWEIVRDDGESAEVYNTSPRGDYYFEDHTSSGLEFITLCVGFCRMYLFLSPIDKRYDGAQITCSIRLPQCSNTTNITDPVTINIQGLLEAPTDIMLEVVSVEKINVSWTPPFTLHGVPILQYSVYIISNNNSEQRNTTDTEITLDRPCVSTSYQITAWNKVGEGTPAAYEVRMYEAIVRSVRPGETCLSCSFHHINIIDFCGPPLIEGCSVTLRSEVTTLSFNITSQNEMEFILFGCFSIQEPGEYSVTVHEIGNSVIWQLGNISVNIQEANQHDNTSTITLFHSKAEQIEGGVCVSCTFSNNSTSDGCIVTLYNDEYKFELPLMRQSADDFISLDCFKVKEPGVYQVTVKEKGMSINRSLILHNVTIVHSNTEPLRDKSAVAGLSTVLCIIFLSLIIVAIVFFVTVYVKRWSKKESAPPHVESNEVEVVPNPQLNYENVDIPKRKPSNPTTLYENVDIPQNNKALPPENTPISYETVELHPQLTVSATGGENNMYEHVEMKPMTERNGDNIIEVNTNPSYGTVQRQV